MNKYLSIIALLMCLSSCVGKHNSDAQKATILKEKTAITRKTIGDTLQINIAGSTIHWRGTKMRGAGKHEGDIEFKNGFFITKNKKLVDGHFTVAMSTIAVTDIPEHEPIPRKNLNAHLRSPDFFDVEKFPISEFRITKIRQITSDSLMISGNLTLKGITKRIVFGAKHQGKSFKTRFTFDRFQWNIAYEGNWADRTLVDKDIELTIEITIE